MLSSVLNWKRAVLSERQHEEKSHPSNVFNLNNIISKTLVFLHEMQTAHSQSHDTWCRWLFFFTYSFRFDSTRCCHKSKRVLSFCTFHYWKCEKDRERERVWETLSGGKKTLNKLLTKIDKCEWKQTNKHKILPSIYSNRTDNKSIYKHRTCSSSWEVTDVAVVVAPLTLL